MVLKNMLAQTVTVTRRTQGMILRSVALDAEDKAAGPFGIDHRKVDEKAGTADLPGDDMAAHAQLRGNLLLEK